MGLGEGIGKGRPLKERAGLADNWAPVWEGGPTSGAKGMEKLEHQPLSNDVGRYRWTGGIAADGLAGKVQNWLVAYQISQRRGSNLAPLLAPLLVFALTFPPPLPISCLPPSTSLRSPSSMPPVLPPSLPLLTPTAPLPSSTPLPNPSSTHECLHVCQASAIPGIFRACGKPEPTSRRKVACLPLCACMPRCCAGLAFRRFGCMRVGLSVSLSCMVSLPTPPLPPSPSPPPPHPALSHMRAIVRLRFQKGIRGCMWT